jgi:hypothetical protein
MCIGPVAPQQNVEIGEHREERASERDPCGCASEPSDGEASQRMTDRGGHPQTMVAAFAIFFKEGGGKSRRMDRPDATGRKSRCV